MRRRTFLAGSAAAMLASGPKGNAQHAHDAKNEFNFLVTQRVHAGKEKEVEAILLDMQAATLTNEKSCLRYECYRASSGCRRPSKGSTCCERYGKIIAIVPGGEIPKAVRITKL